MSAKTLDELTLDLRIQTQALSIELALLELRQCAVVQEQDACPLEQGREIIRCNSDAVRQFAAGCTGRLAVALFPPQRARVLQHFHPRKASPAPCRLVSHRDYHNLL